MAGIHQSASNCISLNCKETQVVEHFTLLIVHVATKTCIKQVICQKPPRDKTLKHSVYLGHFS